MKIYNDVNNIDLCKLRRQLNRKGIALKKKQSEMTKDIEKLNTILFELDLEITMRLKCNTKEWAYHYKNNEI